MARDVHLVGSVPLGSAEAVFEACAAALGARVRRLPDGETGHRTNWIAYQRTLLAETPGLKQLPAAGPLPVFVLDPAHQGPIVFGKLGYDRAATESYAVFKRLAAAGRLGQGRKFQVSLPSPLAVVAQYIEASAQPAAEAPYRDRLMGEVRAILAAIPHADLALQWDVAVEFAVLEGLRRVAFAPVFEGVIARLVDAVDAIPPAVELGLHLCYGDAGHKHFKEPADTTWLVRVANAVAAEARRPIQWVHMPVPRNRDDSAYFAPLRGLRLKPETKLYLGLVHDTDGFAGTRRRMAMADRFVKGYGIATECGFGRRPPETIPALLKLHADAADGG
jgi:hypothetical protein